MLRTRHIAEIRDGMLRGPNTRRHGQGYIHNALLVTSELILTHSRSLQLLSAPVNQHALCHVDPLVLLVVFKAHRDLEQLVIFVVHLGFVLYSSVPS